MNVKYRVLVAFKKSRGGHGHLYSGLKTLGPRSIRTHDGKTIWPKRVNTLALANFVVCKRKRQSL